MPNLPDDILGSLRAHAAKLSDVELREQVVLLSLQVKLLVDALVQIHTPKPTGANALVGAREFTVKTAAGQETLRDLAKVDTLQQMAALLESVR